MNFKLDENLPVELAHDLRRLGHKADTVMDEGLCGAEDSTVVEAARTSQRILLTLDKGIANIVRYPVCEHAGLVLFRPDSTGRQAVLSFIQARLSTILNRELENRLTVVGASRIRIRQ